MFYISLSAGAINCHSLYRTVEGVAAQKCVANLVKVLVSIIIQLLSRISTETFLQHTSDSVESSNSFFKELKPTHFLISNFKTMPASNIHDNRKITKDKRKITFNIITTKYNEALDCQIQSTTWRRVIFKFYLKNSKA